MTEPSMVLRTAMGSRRGNYRRGPLKTVCKDCKADMIERGDDELVSVVSNAPGKNPIYCVGCAGERGLLDD